MMDRFRFRSGGARDEDFCRGRRFEDGSPGQLRFPRSTFRPEVRPDADGEARQNEEAGHGPNNAWGALGAREEEQIEGNEGADLTSGGS